jgi:hypothetical protein
VATVENPHLESRWASLRARVTGKLFRGNGVPAWFVSAVIHGSIFFILASITINQAIRHEIIITPTEVKLDDTPLPKEFHFSPEPQEKIGALGSGGLDEARPTAPAQGDISSVPYGIEPSQITTTTPQPGDIIQNIGNIDVHDFNRTVLESPNIPENVIVKGAGTAGTTGAEGAIDRITHEILLSLDTRCLAVRSIWQSQAAARSHRQAVRSRLQRARHRKAIGQQGIQTRGRTAAHLNRRIWQHREAADAQAHERFERDPVRRAWRRGRRRRRRQRKRIQFCRLPRRKVSPSAARQSAP